MLPFKLALLFTDSLASPRDILSFFLSTNFFFFYGHACGILILVAGTEPAPSAMEAQCLNHWTTREDPIISFFIEI